MFRLPVYQDLSKEQDSITNLPIKGNYLVVGPPGTGKTVVALYRAEIFRNAGEDARFIVFNNTLDHYLGLAIREKNLANQTSTYNSWLPTWYYANFKKRVPQLQPYKYDWKAIIEEIGRNGGHIRKVKHIILDEGQDFPRQLYAVLPLIAENITVFADENQRIKEENSTIEDIQSALCVDRIFPLKKNYRNTRPIAAFAREFYAGLATGVAELPKQPGDLPVFLPGKDYQAQMTIIAQYANANRNKQIGVFVSTQRTQYGFLLGLQERCRNVEIQMYQAGSKKRVDFMKNGIFILCYPSTKGLEFDTVFHPELQNWRTDGNADIQRMLFYVMTSRARSELILMSRNPDVPPLLQNVPPELYTIRNVDVNANS